MQSKKCRHEEQERHNNFVMIYSTRCRYHHNNIQQHLFTYSYIILYII